MQDDPAFYGPLQYSTLWMWAGIALAALVAAWYLYVFRSTRQAPPAAPNARPAPLTDLPALKAMYVQRIDDAEQRAATGTLSARAAHQEISHLMRRFVRDATGVDAPRMTRTDLERHPLPAAAEAVGAMYPGEFGPEPVPSVTSTAATAREAVRSWS